MKTKKGRTVTKRFVPLVINGFRFLGYRDTWMPKPVFNVIKAYSENVPNVIKSRQVLETKLQEFYRTASSGEVRKVTRL